MIFVDYLGPAARFTQARAIAAREIGAALRVPTDAVVVRRIVTESGEGVERDDVELWVELSSEEQLYRVGRQIARGVADGLREGAGGPSVWVMFRVVPRSHAFLDGEPRGRGMAPLD